MTTSGSYNLKPNFFEKTYEFLCLSGVEDESYRNLLDTDEFERWGGLIVLQAKLNNFPHPLHKRVQVFRLSVATSQGGHGSDVVVLFISFDDNREFPLSFHVLILARRRTIYVVETRLAAALAARAALGLDERGARPHTSTYRRVFASFTGICSTISISNPSSAATLLG